MCSLVKYEKGATMTSKTIIGTGEKYLCWCWYGKVRSDIVFGDYVSLGSIWLLDFRIGLTLKFYFLILTLLSTTARLYLCSDWAKIR